jgi:site-specific DNA-methyltransferase (adenine-specific)
MILNTIDRAHQLDILECIANLSTNEVATAPSLANEILDTLPTNVWTDPKLRWLDPCAKTGVFLREVARRLLVGLQTAIPNEVERREHIYKNMLFGFPITELTGQISRRTLYYTKDASKAGQSVVTFENSDGNLAFNRFEHSYPNQSKSCSICGAKMEILERGIEKDNHAYAFIHDKEVLSMKFDVIVGNPPYQLGDGGGGKGTSAKPIYHLFVNQAFKLKPKYVAMVIPSRWFSGGKGLDDFREKMLASTKFRKLVDYTDAKEIFPGTQIKGGVCYFLWDSSYDGPCEILRIQNGEVGKSVKRHLNAHGKFFIRFNEATPILERVLSKSSTFVSSTVLTSNPYDFRAHFKGYINEQLPQTVGFYCVDGIKFVYKDSVKKNAETIDLWKTVIGKAGPGNDGYPHKIIGEPFVIPPGAICSETYLVIQTFESEQEANYLAEYMRTKFFRFMMSLIKNTQNISRNSFDFVPQMPMDVRWNDDKLYRYFGVSTVEQQFIDTIVRPMVGKD